MQKYMNNKIILKNVSTENCRNGRSDYVLYSTVQYSKNYITSIRSIFVVTFVANCPIKSVLLPDRADRTTL